MQEENNEVQVSKIESNLPVLFIDSLWSWEGSDGMYFIKMGTSVPAGFQAQVQFTVTKKDLKEILGTLCEITDYYPVKKEKKATKSRTKKE